MRVFLANIGLSFIVSLFFPAQAVSQWQEQTQQQPADDVLEDSSCSSQYKKHRCHELLKNKDLAPFVKDCSKPQSSPILPSLVGECGFQFLKVWGETLHALQMSPQALMSEMSRNLKKKTQARVKLIQWQLRCQKDVSCVAQLIQASSKTSQPPAQLKKEAQNVVQSWRRNQLFQFYYNKASHLNSFGPHKDPWFQKQMDRTFRKTTKKNQTSIYHAARRFIEGKYRRLQCLNTQGKTFMLCYGAAWVIDPAIAAAVLAKSARLSKMAKELENPVIRERVRKKELIRAKKLKQTPKKPLAKMTEKELDEFLMQFKTHEDQARFIKNLSDEDFFSFFDRAFARDHVVREAMERKDYITAREIMATPRNTKSVFKTVAYRYHKRENKRKKLGPPPGDIQDIQRTHNGIPDAYRELQYIDKDKKLRGTLSYEFDASKKHLFIPVRYLERVEDAGRGIQGVLFKKIIEKYPQTRSVSSSFVESNKLAIKEALKKGATCAEAVMTTPAYRIAAKQGFKKVLKADCGPLMEASFGR